MALVGGRVLLLLLLWLRGRGRLEVAWLLLLLLAVAVWLLFLRLLNARSAGLGLLSRGGRIDGLREGGRSSRVGPIGGTSETIVDGLTTNIQV